LYFECHTECSKCSPLVCTGMHKVLFVLTQHLHSHFVHMWHLSYCNCVSRMLVINKYYQNNEFICQINSDILIDVTVTWLLCDPEECECHKVVKLLELWNVYLKEESGKKSNTGWYAVRIVVSNVTQYYTTRLFQHLLLNMNICIDREFHNEMK